MGDLSHRKQAAHKAHNPWHSQLNHVCDISSLLVSPFWPSCDSFKKIHPKARSVNSRSQVSTEFDHNGLQTGGWPVCWSTHPCTREIWNRIQKSIFNTFQHLQQSILSTPLKFVDSSGTSRVSESSGLQAVPEQEKVMNRKGLCPVQHRIAVCLVHALDQFEEI